MRHPNPPRKPLMPPELQAMLPAWRSTAEEEDPLASVKYFMPGTGWTWYVVEYDGEDVCFGLVSGHVIEAGYFSISELEGIYDGLRASGAIARFLREGAIVLPVERDEHFKPAKLSELRRQHTAHDTSAQWTPEP